MTPVSQGGPLTSLEPPLHHHNLGGLPPEGAQFLPHHKDMSPSPEPGIPMTGTNEVFRPDRFIPSRGGAITPGGPPLPPNHNGFVRTLSHEVNEAGVW